MLVEVVSLFVTFLLLFYVLQWITTPPGLPAGPPRFPLIGTLPSLLIHKQKFMFQTLKSFAKVYGDIFTVYLPGRATVVINSVQLAREALVTQKDTFSGRPYLFTTYYLSRGGKGLGFSDYGPALVLCRKIVHSAFRMYQPNLEERIVQEAAQLTKRFKKYNGESFDPKMDLFLAIVNVLHTVLYGTKHFEMNDQEFVEHVEYSDGVASLLGPMNILNIFPWLINFPVPQTKLMKELIAKRARIRDARYFRIKETFQQNKIRHMLDALLQAKLDEEREDAKAREVTDDSYIMSSSDALFRAGSETTTSTLYWLLAAMINYPEIQEKNYNELRKTFGDADQVSLSKRKDCHFLEATLSEVSRRFSIAPVFPHKTKRTTTLAGFKIPEDTTVLMNFYAINNDEREWARPSEFNPERFLDVAGVFKGTANMSYMPFGAGRRNCVGESLAKQELFLLAATMLLKFKFENPSGCCLPDLNDGILGLTFNPKPFKIIAKER